MAYKANARSYQQILPSDNSIAREEVLIEHGVFHKNYIPYNFVMTAIGCVLFPPFAVFLPCMWKFFQTRFASLRLELTDKNLTYTEGYNACFCCCWNQDERIVPLEKITDVTWRQTWLQRLYDISSLNVRTASGGLGSAESAGRADIELVALDGAKEFRDKLLLAKAQKEESLGRQYMPVTNPDASASASAGGIKPGELADLMRRQLALMERLEAQTRAPGAQSMV